MAGRLRVAALARAEGDTRGGAQCVGQGQGASVLDHLLRDHGDGLRRIQQRRGVLLRRRAVDVIGGFVLLLADDGGRIQRQYAVLVGLFLPGLVGVGCLRCGDGGDGDTDGRSQQTLRRNGGIRGLTRHSKPLPGAVKVAEFIADQNCYQLLRIRIRQEFTFFTIFSLHFSHLARLQPLAVLHVQCKSISLAIISPSWTAPCCCIFPPSSPPRKSPGSAQPWSRRNGPTARRPPATNRPRPSTTCNCRRTTRWPGRSAKPCCSACGTIPCSCPPPCRSGLPAAVQLLYRRGSFDFHIDNAVRDVHGGRERVRTDLSSTLFFSDPEDYDGGELVIQDTYGLQQVKLPAGDLVLYPRTSLHKVNPVTAARATPRSSGPRAWSAKTVSAPCYSKWTSRSSDSPTTCPTIPR